jgi:D-serine deaminase-like pyridoxal phosphate-dependent protein
MQPQPGLRGAALDRIETPALIVDLDALERNIARMAAFGRQSGLRIRPHAKTHRCPPIAVKQVAAGAVGMCAQTVGEAEALVEAGIADVLVTNQVLAPGKLARFARLAERARVALICDSAEGVTAASRAASEHGVEVGALVEVDVGMGRCGVAPGAPARDLARRIADAPNLGFRGLQAYHGRAQHLPRHADRRAAIQEAAEAVRETLGALDQAGLSAAIVGGAGTGTFRLEAAAGLWTELQPGSYVFMDREYAEIEGASGQSEPDFEHSLFVLATVISRSETRAVADAGLKSLSGEKGLPLLHDLAGAEVVGISDEHSVITLASRDPRLQLGDRLRLIPGHCDPSVNLHDWIVAVRSDRVEEIWPVAARGASG